MISVYNNLFHDQIADKVRVITTTNNNIMTNIQMDCIVFLETGKTNDGIHNRSSSMSFG